MRKYINKLIVASCRFSPEELRRLPLGTILDYEYLLPPKRGTSPPPVIVHDEELLSPLSNEADQDTLPTLQSAEDRQTGATGDDSKTQVSTFSFKWNVCIVLPTTFSLSLLIVHTPIFICFVSFSLRNVLIHSVSFFESTNFSLFIPHFSLSSFCFILKQPF